jgi:hypothetical protein
MRTFEVTILCACMVGSHLCRMVAHIYCRGVGGSRWMGKTWKKLAFYANKICRWAVAQQIPGRLGSPGYQIDPHGIPDSKHSLLFLIGSILGPFIPCSKVRKLRLCFYHGTISYFHTYFFFFLISDPSSVYTKIGTISYFCTQVPFIPRGRHIVLGDCQNWDKI